MGEFSDILWKTFLIYLFDGLIVFFLLIAMFNIEFGGLDGFESIFAVMVGIIVITGWIIGIFFYILPIAKNEMKKPLWLVLYISFVILLPAVLICYYLLQNNILIPNYQYSSINSYSSSSPSKSSLPNTSKWANRKNTKDEESDDSNLVSQTYIPPTQQAELKNINSLLNSKFARKPCPHCGVPLQSEFDKFCLSCNKMI